MDIKEYLSSKKNKLILASIIFIILLIILFIIYYFLFFLKPNFNDESTNYIKPISSQQVKPGSEIQVKLSYKNTGYRQVKNLNVEFYVPEYTKFKLSDKVGKYYEDKKLIVFEDNNLKRNEEKNILITLVVDLPVDNKTEIKVKDAKINYKLNDKASKFLTFNIKSFASFEVQSSPKLSLNNLEVRDLNGGFVNMRDTLGYSFNAKNSGDMNAKDVEVTAIIPPKTSVVESSINPKNYKVTNNEITWQISNFEINTQLDFSFNLKVLQGFNDMENINEKVNLKSKQGDLLSLDVDSQVRLFPDLGNSKLQIIDENGDYTWAGDKILIKISLLNDGERSAQNVKLECPIPKNTLYINNSSKCDEAKITSKNNTLLFELENIGINEVKEASFELQISPQITNGGTIKTDFNLSAEGVNFNFPNQELKVKPNYKVTIACMGDSLIALSNWPQIINSYLESTYIHSDYNVIASGIQGEMASGGFARFDSTIAKYRPQIVIIGYGTNDIGSGTDRFNYYLSGIVQKAKNIGATVLLESLSYIDTNKEPAKSDWQRYQNVIYQVGASFGVPVIDIYTPISQNPQAYLTDWVHYTPEGSKVVAETIFHYLVQYLDSNGIRK